MHDSDEPDDRRDTPERPSRLRRLGRRIIGDPEADVPGEKRGSLLGDAKEVLGAVIEGGGQAKSEVVRAVAREVRNYLEELGLKEDLRHLMTNYSFEVHASVNLRKLAEEDKLPKGKKEG